MKRALDHGLKITISDLRHPRVDAILDQKLQKQLALKQQLETPSQKAARLQLNRDKKQLEELTRKAHKMARDKIARAQEEHFRDELSLRHNLAHRAISQRLEQVKSVLADLSAAKLPESPNHLEALRHLAAQPDQFRQVRTRNIISFDPSSRPIGNEENSFGSGSLGSGPTAFQPPSFLPFSASGASDSSTGT